MTTLGARLTCPYCGAACDVDVDVEGTLVGLLARERDRLVSDVDRLARAYHWSEADILALSPQRRRLYLQRLEAQS